MMKEYHVSVKGSDLNHGTAEQPFRTISQAAQVARAGDTVTVHEGIYREWIKPVRGGRSSVCPIIYRAAPGEKVILKGSERISCWQRQEDGVWKAALPNEMFGDYNPYNERIDGDWLLRPREPFLHTGEVYLDGVALREQFTLDGVKCKENTWYAEVDTETTVIYTNFGDVNPNEAMAEINVRKCCFYPEKTGVDYITIRGFEMAQAATPWAPPTAEQFGMIGVHWSKGWVIEDNILHDSKCCGVSLGYDSAMGFYPEPTSAKDGTQRHIENVFRAKQMGWSKEIIGSHTVRNNVIYNCGQCGVVGHMCSAFSRIYNNHIYHIADKQEFYGAELGGIKLHAAIDTQIYDNYVHDCRDYAVWLDWQAQGVRVSKNLFQHNFIDLFIEVGHGPYLVDNNIFGSVQSLQNMSQGGAFVHNVFLGATRHAPDNRVTPYHCGHTTDIAGYAKIVSGDDRYLQNIFAISEEPEGDSWTPWRFGTENYQGCAVSRQEYAQRVEDKSDDYRLPVLIDANCYFGKAQAFDREEHKIIGGDNFKMQLIEKDGAVYLESDISCDLSQLPTVLITTERLGTSWFAECPYENPDGTPITFDVAFSGNKRTTAPTPGAIEGLRSGYHKILLWQDKI